MHSLGALTSNGFKVMRPAGEQLPHCTVAELEPQRRQALYPAERLRNSCQSVGQNVPGTLAIPKVQNSANNQRSVSRNRHHYEGPTHTGLRLAGQVNNHLEPVPASQVMKGLTTHVLAWQQMLTSGSRGADMLADPARSPLYRRDDINQRRGSWRIDQYAAVRINMDGNAWHRSRVLSPDAEANELITVRDLVG